MTGPRKPVARALGPREAIDALFTYHPASPDDEKRYTLIRHHARELAHTIQDQVPSGPDRTAAIRALREAVAWANAGIATKGAAGALW